jgi:hypothetical protein
MGKLANEKLRPLFSHSLLQVFDDPVRYLEALKRIWFDKF